jgi:transcriptional regulator with GAF, ATPase, and Fis domain
LAATFSKKALEAVDMSSTARLLSEDTLSSDPELSGYHFRAEASVFQNKIRLLKLQAVELQQGLESLTEAQPPNVELSIDFYDAVRHFEIELIKRALKFANGHQKKAARLLNLNASTLGAKIKHYGIRLGHPAFFKDR